MIYTLLKFFHTVYGAQYVYAHCDIPCGIYTPEPAQTAAKTVVKMVEKIQELEPPNFMNLNIEVAKGKINSLARYIATKEDHAQKCKQELFILWSDYFKPEHLSMFPELHDTFWRAVKLCSKNKQEISIETAKELSEAVENITDMFTKAEATKVG
jgi:nickel superoxide dismutase